MEVNAASDREAVLAALDACEAAFDKLASLRFDALTPREIVTVLARREVLARRQPAVEHRLLNRLTTDGVPADFGATTMPKALAHHLKISITDATRRLAEAADLAPRTTLTGQPLPPELPAIAEAQAAGLIGGEHVEIIRGFFDHLPDHVDLATRIEAERQLASDASDFGPEQFRKLANRLMSCLDQDGELTEKDRARRRGLTLHKQGSDGLSKVTGYLTPEARAVWEPIFAKSAAPGMCHDADAIPCVDDTPTEEQVKGDHRTAAQRHHDAFLAAGRAVLASGKLGQLNGLPVTVIVSTTLSELESASGHAATAGGSLVPMRDVIRMATHAHHYLAIFDDHGRALYLGRSRRIASKDQRIVLHARDRGCTAPGCTASAYISQVHHAARAWGDGGLTDVDDLTLACGPDNRKVEKEGWVTLRNKNGRTEWIRPLTSTPANPVSMDITTRRTYSPREATSHEIS